MAGFKDKVKKLFKGNKGSSKRGNDQSSIQDRYGVPEQNFQKNPLFEKNTEENEFVNPLYGMELGEIGQKKKEEPEEVLQPKVNSLENVAGMPTKSSIEKMAGGVSVKRLRKYKNFANALNALEEYQRIMQEPRSMKINEAAMRRRVIARKGVAGIEAGQKEAKDAFQQLSLFITTAEAVLANMNGFFARRSSSLREMAPILANMLMHAYNIIPKLAHLDYVIPQYVIVTDQDTFTFEEILNHQLTAGRADGYAMRGAEETNGAVVLNPDKVLNTLNAQGAFAEEAILELRKNETEAARMNLPIPILPAGLLKEVSEKNSGAENKKKLGEDAKKIADSYIAQLRILMRVLDETAESNEGNNEDGDRINVHGKQAEHFRMSKLLYQVIQAKDLLAYIIINGIPPKETPEFEKILKLGRMGGMPLSDGVEAVNKEAMSKTSFVRLVDAENKELVEGDTQHGYVVGGATASISILDFENKRVLRAQKNSKGGYLTEDEQKKAINGINDEVAGKISEFLGFHVVAKAEAAGFMAKERNGSKEEAVFGGSVMELVKGKTAKEIKFQTNDNQVGDNGKTPVNIMKNGRLLGEIMKMNVVDYIIMHGDRNPGNFLINMDAKEDEAMVTAIDNDMIFGINTAGQKIGHEMAEEALLGIKDRALMDFGSKLKTIMPMVSKEVKTAIRKVDIHEFNELLMPYVDRVARIAAVHRVEELKKWVEGVEECDFTKTEDVQKFINMQGRETVDEWIRQLRVDGKALLNNKLNLMPNIFFQYILVGDGIVDTNDLQPKDIIRILQYVGIQEDEVRELLLKNISSSSSDDVAVTEEQLGETKLGEYLGFGKEN